jgi:hypothetical protein
MAEELKTYDTRLSDETTQMLFSMARAEVKRLSELSRTKMTWEEHQKTKSELDIIKGVHGELTKAVSLGAYIRSQEPPRVEKKLTFCEWIKSRKCNTSVG